jgi:K+-sensing histidine kinase KdpD
MDVLTSQDKKILFLADKGVVRIRMTINNILSITKFEKGAIGLNKTEFQVKSAIEDAMKVFQGELLARPHTIMVISSFADNFSIKTDKELFSRVVINILSNALRFSPAEENISLTITPGNDNFIDIAVTNSGSFIEEADRNTIFEKFSPVDPVLNKSNSRDFGLGLTFCKMAVNFMEGRIWVESNKEKLETTFRFSIRNFKDS